MGRTGRELGDEMKTADKVMAAVALVAVACCGLSMAWDGFSLPMLSMALVNVPLALKLFR